MRARWARSLHIKRNGFNFRPWRVTGFGHSLLTTWLGHGGRGQASTAGTRHDAEAAGIDDCRTTQELKRVGPLRRGRALRVLEVGEPTAVQRLDERLHRGNQVPPPDAAHWNGNGVSFLS